MVTRTAKIKPTLTSTAAPEAAREESSFMRYIFDRFERSDTPEVSIGRTTAALLLSLTAGGAAIYVGLQLTAYLAVGCAMLTGVEFLVFMVSFIGAALAILGGIVLTGKVQAYILEGGIDKTYNKVREFFARKVALT
jgi:hypothetical protein